MTTPGSNLFNQALRLIKPTLVGFLQYTGRSQNAARQFVPSFAAQVDIWASVQAVSRSAYKQFGLDLQKQYIKIFVAADVVNIARDSSGDRFIYNGRLFQIENENGWFLMDGWVSCMAVDIGSSTGSIT